MWICGVVSAPRSVVQVGDIRVERNAGDRYPEVGQRTETRRDGHGRLKAKTAAVHVGLHLVSLLSKVKVGLCGDEDGWNMVQ